jgi:hypothetical protein
MKNEQLDKLERLAKLKQEGIITDEEFTEQKKQILNDLNLPTKDVPLQSGGQKANSNDFQQTKQDGKKINKPKIQARSIVLGLILFLTLGYAFFSYMQRQDEIKRLRLEAEEARQKEIYENSPEVMRQKLFMQERSNPLDHLQIINYEYSSGFLFGSDKIILRLQNTATLASFKDIKVEIDWLSETSTVIDSEYRVIYKQFSPNQELRINIDDVKKPRIAAKFKVKVVNADLVNEKM